MRYSIQQPELFDIKDKNSPFVSFGGDQAWYAKFWNRKSGCGPTSASNITAYLGMTKPDYRKLYTQSTLYKQDFIEHMEILFKYITPGLGGVNHVTKFTTGLKRFIEHSKLNVAIHTFSVEGKENANRDVNALRDFVTEALRNDCPIAFLNLSNGHESILQSWHWITIISADIEPNSIMATASDEGEVRTFDLQKWFTSTPMHGGLVYIKPE